MAQVSTAALVSVQVSSPPTPTEQILFHVRFIDKWRASSTSQSHRFSFFGLELELRGQNGASAGSVVLDFSSGSRSSQRQDLIKLSGPFTVVVVAKMPLDEATDQQKALLQLTVPVQVQNQLARVNKIHFLKSCSTGADVYRELVRVLDMASVARPSELTFLRHNHAQAATKIRPFAARADVQKAQVAQFEKLQNEESKWPEERRKRKQFVLQQLDFYREQYLYDYISGRLQFLHEEIMGGGQWHAYEFEKALWYYHAPSDELFAEHPMRNNEKTRELIGSVQIRTRMAAQKLQHGARAFLRRNRLINAATERAFEGIVNEVWASSVDDACMQVSTARAQAATERLLDAIVDEVWVSSVDAECIHASAAQAQAAKEKLQATTAKTGKVRNVLGKFIPRKVIPSEAPKEPTPPEEQQPPPEREVVEAAPEPQLRPPEVGVSPNTAVAELEKPPERPRKPEPPILIEKQMTEEQTQTDPPPEAESAFLTEKQMREEQTQTDPPPHIDIPTISTEDPQPISVPETVRVAVQAPPPPEPRTAEHRELCEPQPSPTGEIVASEPLHSSTSYQTNDVTPHTTRSEPKSSSSRPDDDENDEDDDDLVTNWRSRLRLLKRHYEKRPKKSKMQVPGPHNIVIVGHGSSSFSSTIEPALHDRSASLLLDLAIDGPLSSNLLASLKEPKYRSESDNYGVESSPWRRDGSFRSFHDFFTGSSTPETKIIRQSNSPRISLGNKYDYDDEREIIPAKAAAKSAQIATKLPKLGPPAPSAVQQPPQLANDHTNTTLEASGATVTPSRISPPKKLPYIRRRKR